MVTGLKHKNYTKTIPKSYHYGALRFVCLILTVFITNCGYLAEYDKAQDYFNIAAEADNRQKFLTDDPGKELTSFGNVHTNYALAYKHISGVISGNRKNLENDGLLGGALTIKALCEWKLGKYDAALATSESALRHLKAEPGVPIRDLALMTAMPGLIKADQAYFHTMSPHSSKGYEDIRQIIEGAIRDLVIARQMVDKGHPVQAFLQMSRLAVYRTWEVAIQEKIDKPAERAKEEDKIFNSIEQELGILERLIGKDNAMYKYWRYILGF